VSISRTWAVRAPGPIVRSHGFELSPAGARIAYVAGKSCGSTRGAIFLEAIDRRVHAFGHPVKACGDCSYPAFPDGYHLSWIDTRRNLRIARVADIEKHGAQAASVVIRLGVSAAAWSHDGRIVAIDDGSKATVVLFARDRAAGYDRPRPAFTTTRLPFVHASPTGPIAPDGVHMLVTRLVGRDRTHPLLAVRNLHSGVVKTLKRTFALSDPSNGGRVLPNDFVMADWQGTSHLRAEDWAGFPSGAKEPR
jgi:hypothetical protein